MESEEEGEALHGAPQRAQDVQDLRQAEAASPQVTPDLHGRSSDGAPPRPQSAFCVCSHSVRKTTVPKSEATQIPDLPKGGEEEGRGDTISSRKVRLLWRVWLDLMSLVIDCVFESFCVFQKQLEDYLNKLLKMQKYRNYHATVRM